MPCESSDEKPFCPEEWSCDYITTMQDSYSSPYPFCMKRLSVPVLPFLKYRKLKFEDAFSKNQFFDEGFEDHVKVLQNIKGDRHVSFNPLMGEYSDGSTNVVAPPNCVKLEYDKRDEPSNFITGKYGYTNN